MANGSSGPVILGLVIGIVLAAQAGSIDFDGADVPEASSDVTVGSADNESALADAMDDTTVGTSSNGGADGSTTVGSDGPSTTPGMGLDTPGVINSVDGGRVVALTFSGGPDPVYTQEILDVLERHNVRATFCMTGEDVRANQIVVQNIAANGHTLCNHGNTHDFRLAERDDAQIQQELRGGRNAIEEAVPGASIPYFRAHGGCFSPEVNQIAETYGHDPLGWNVDPRDWENRGPQAIADAVVDAVEPGAVVILHDGGGNRSDTVGALDLLIPELRSDGYEFVTPDS